MTEYKPFGPRVTVTDSPLDASRPSGLVVVQFGEGDRGGLRRGVVLDVGVAPGAAEELALLKPGTVVWYRRSYKIGDTHVVDLIDIVSYEEG